MDPPLPPLILNTQQAGYRHLDTAWFYGTAQMPEIGLYLTYMFSGTEVSVGAAIRESGIPREDIFITTKLPFVCLPSSIYNSLHVTSLKQLASLWQGRRIHRSESHQPWARLCGFGST